MAPDAVMDLFPGTDAESSRPHATYGNTWCYATARTVREGYFADYAHAALRLLPEWTEWRIGQSGLGGDAAARFREAARAAHGVCGREDDYDAEFRYDRDPVGALQA
jgi:hypothetical protein